MFAWTLAAVVHRVALVTTNWLRAPALSAFAIFFYVVVYTILLKRRTEQNIVWGGIAGCFGRSSAGSAVSGIAALAAGHPVLCSSSSGLRRTTGRCR